VIAATVFAFGVVGLTKVHAERKPSSPPINPEKEAKKIVFSDIRILSYRDTDVAPLVPLGRRALDHVATISEIDPAPKCKAVKISQFPISTASAIQA
jgi:hypothetical protein